MKWFLFTCLLTIACVDGPEVYSPDDTDIYYRNSEEEQVAVKKPSNNGFEQEYDTEEENGFVDTEKNMGVDFGSDIVESDEDSEAMPFENTDKNTDVVSDTGSSTQSDEIPGSDTSFESETESETIQTIDTECITDSDSEGSEIETEAETESETVIQLDTEEIETEESIICNGVSKYGICWFVAEKGETCDSACELYGGWDEGGAKTLEPYDISEEADPELEWAGLMFDVIREIVTEARNEVTSGSDNCSGVYIHDSGTVFNGKRLQQTSDCDWEYVEHYRRLCACGDSGFSFEEPEVETGFEDTEEEDSVNIEDTEGVCPEGGAEYPVGENICWYYAPQLPFEQSDCFNVCRTFGLEYDDNTEWFIQDRPEDCVSIVQEIGIEGDTGWFFNMYDHCGLSDKTWNVGAPGCVYRHDPSLAIEHSIKTVLCDGDIDPLYRTDDHRICACKEG